MDIAALSTSLSMVDTQNQVGALLLSKSMDTAEELSDGMIKMMEQSVNPAVGQNIDISI